MKTSKLLFLTFAGWLPACLWAFRLYEAKEGAGRPVCFDKYRSVEELERYADFIITGTVERLAPSPNDYHQHMAIIRVRRIFKPNKESHQVMVHSEVSSRVAVINVGDPNVCRSDLKEKDTKIFFLASASERAASNYYNSENSPSSLDFTTLPPYMLNSSVIPLTLRNLDTVEAAVKGKFSFFAACMPRA